MCFAKRSLIKKHVPSCREFIKDISYVPKTKKMFISQKISSAKLYLFLQTCVLPFLACSLCSNCSGNTNYNGCTAVSYINLQCARARMLHPVGTRVSSVQMTLFGRLSFFPFLHLLNLFGAIHKSRIQGVFQTEYELPFTVNMTFHY